MRPRQDVIDTFSSFLQFDGDSRTYWSRDHRLVKSIEKRQSAQPGDARFWALYWYQTWHSQLDELAATHLSAYLQEACYWAARRTSANFSSVQYTLSDCFQTGLLKMDAVLRGFKPGHGTSLESYAGVAFGNVIRDTLRQCQEVDICSNWTLLRKLSKKRLIESLQSAGQAPDAIERYVLAWVCFKEIYVPAQNMGTRKHPAPDKSTWEEVARLYNAERVSQLDTPGPEYDAQKVEQWMRTCAVKARSYLYPNALSLNPQGPNEPTIDLPDSRESPLQALIATEEHEHEQARKDQLNTVLAVALSGLDLKDQKRLEVYYGQNLTQKQIAVQFEVDQPTICKQLSKSRKSLLKALVRWSRDTQHISPPPDVLKYMSTVLEEWLTARYSSSNLSSALEQTS